MSYLKNYNKFFTSKYILLLKTNFFFTFINYYNKVNIELRTISDKLGTLTLLQVLFKNILQFLKHNGIVQVGRKTNLL